MKLLSVNVSPPKDVEFRGKVIRTGIFKNPCRVRVRTLNIDGDGQADSVAHGGEQRAVLVYSKRELRLTGRQPTMPTRGRV